jgi:hypothetical protein
MQLSDLEALKIMRENAALCNLEAEVIVALKAYHYNEQEILQSQLNHIVTCLQRIDEVRKRNAELQ